MIPAHINKFLDAHCMGNPLCSPSVNDFSLILYDLLMESDQQGEFRIISEDIFRSHHIHFYFFCMHFSQGFRSYTQYIYFVFSPMVDMHCWILVCSSPPAICLYTLKSMLFSNKNLAICKEE